MPFYKVEDDSLISATHIDGPDYSLSEAGKDEYTYPVFGWCWFADLEAAMEATGKSPL